MRCCGGAPGEYNLHMCGISRRLGNDLGNAEPWHQTCLVRTLTLQWRCMDMGAHFGWPARCLTCQAIRVGALFPRSLVPNQLALAEVWETVHGMRSMLASRSPQQLFVLPLV